MYFYMVSCSLFFSNVGMRLSRIKSYKHYKLKPLHKHNHCLEVFKQNQPFLLIRSSPSYLPSPSGLSKSHGVKEKFVLKVRQV